MTYRILTTLAVSIALASCGVSTGGAGSGGTGPVTVDNGVIPTAEQVVSLLDSSVVEQNCAGLMRTLTVSTEDSEASASQTVTITANISNTSTATISDTRTACTSFTLTDSTGNQQSLTHNMDCDLTDTTTQIESYAPDQQVAYVVNWQPVDTGQYRVTFNHQAQDNTGQSCPALFLDIDVS